MSDDNMIDLIRSVAKIEQSANNIGERMASLEISIGALRLILADVPILRNDVKYLQDDVKTLENSKADKADLDEVKAKITGTEDMMKKMVGRIIMGLSVAAITYVAGKFGIVLPKF